MYRDNLNEPMSTITIINGVLYNTKRLISLIGECPSVMFSLNELHDSEHTVMDECRSHLVIPNGQGYTVLVRSTTPVDSKDGKQLCAIVSKYVLKKARHVEGEAELNSAAPRHQARVVRTGYRNTSPRF